MAENNDFAMGYALGQDSNGNNNNGGFGGWGGDWIWAFLIFALFGWGNGGFGGFGGGGGGALTRADLCQGFNFNNLDSAVRGVQNGLCDGFYAMNTGMLNGFSNLGMSMMQGFNGVQSQLCNMAAQNQACCCETQRLIERGFADTNYNMATNTCALQNTMNTNTRDIIENQNAGTRAILDYLCQDKISTLQSENQALRLAASQANQNATIGAMIDAKGAEIIRRTGNDCPIPAYVVPNPNCCYGNPYGVGYGNGYGYNNGCGNGCGCNSCGC